MGKRRFEQQNEEEADKSEEFDIFDEENVLELQAPEDELIRLEDYQDQRWQWDKKEQERFKVS